MANLNYLQKYFYVTAYKLSTLYNTTLKINSTFMISYVVAYLCWVIVKLENKNNFRFVKKINDIDREKLLV